MSGMVERGLEASFNPACDCIECRIRAACDFKAGPQDLEPIVMALGNVMAECLAHVSTGTAKRMAAELLIARKKWQKEPRVAIQHPAGTA